MPSAPPVANPQNEQHPISSGVHLRLDPRNEGNKNPLLYADCEGLNCGDRKPKSLLKGTLRYIRESLVQIVQLARGAEVGREPMISTSYSRLIYTFCDDVVFVLVNARYLDYPP